MFKLNNKKNIYLAIILLSLLLVVVIHYLRIESHLKSQWKTVKSINQISVPRNIEYSANSTRNKHKQPFAVNSIWNLPIRLDATYIPANFGEVYNISPDINFYIITDKNDPKVNWYKPINWGVGRCEMGGKKLGNIPVPYDLIVPDATKNKTPNNSAAFLQPDGHTLIQMNPLTRCQAGGPVFGHATAKKEDIYGLGITGGQGGSGLSSIGGTIRTGELLPDAPPIRHVLKLLVYAHQYLYGQPPGYRWPAIRADAYAFDDTSKLRYGGTNPNLVMGALLAIPPDVIIESLKLETIPGQKLFYALQDFGGYIVDDRAWDSYGIAVEKGVPEEFEDTYGFSFSGNRKKPSPFFRDVNKLFQALEIVTNNSPIQNLDPDDFRQPLAPAIRDDLRS